jgi:hypothetical protein
MHKDNLGQIHVEQKLKHMIKHHFSSPARPEPTMMMKKEGDRVT